MARFARGLSQQRLTPAAREPNDDEQSERTHAERRAAGERDEHAAARAHASRDEQLRFVLLHRVAVGFEAVALALVAAFVRDQALECFVTVTRGRQRDQLTKWLERGFGIAHGGVDRVHLRRVVVHERDELFASRDLSGRRQ